MKKTLLKAALAGVVLGNVLVSPIAMALFHLAHTPLVRAVTDEMVHSTWGAVMGSFDPRLALWSTGFSVLGALVGVGVGWMLWKLKAGRDLALAQAAALVDSNRQLQEAYGQVDRANRLGTLGLMAGTLVQDLGKQLTTMRITAELELADIEVRRRPSSPWSSMLQQVRWMQRLVDSVQAFARRNSKEVVVADLHDAVDQALLVVGGLLDQKAIRIERELNAAATSVRAVPSDLLQALVNLIHNAHDAMDRAGSLTLQSRNVDGGIELLVSDSGVGIPSAMLPRIFEAFFTTKPEGQGTGLGLPIAKRVIEDHDGTLGVRSEPGQGATFRIWLPNVPESTVASTTPACAVEVPMSMHGPH